MVASAIAKFLQLNLVDHHLRHRHSTFFAFRTAQHLPPKVLQHCLSHYLQDYSASPSLGYMVKMQPGEVLEKIRKEPDYFGKIQEEPEAK
jgi:hypothetical protein